MFSDYIGAIRTLLNIPLSSLLALTAAFSFAFWLLGKVFRTVVLEGHWMVLALAGFIAYSLVAGVLLDGQPIVALALSVPLALIGRETYRRLAGA